MASIRRLARALHSHYRTLAASPSLSPSPSLPHNGNFGCHGRTFSSRSVPSTTIPATLAGLLGVGVLDVAYADSDEPVLFASSIECPGLLKGFSVCRSGVAWQLALSRPQKKNGAAGEQAGERDTNPYDEDLCILIFRPLISADKAEIEFMKPGSFTEEELDALLQLAGQQKTLDLRSRGDAGPVPSADKTVTTLESIGVKIFGINASNNGIVQESKEIEDTILLALQNPEVYDDIARGTRRKFETNRPRAVLFEGPPGTGKTSCARVIANQAGVPLLYVPLEIIMSKYYGESERLLGKVFSLANDLPDGAIIFFDEVDSFATAHDGETHEATRRLLSVLLRQRLVAKDKRQYLSFHMREASNSFSEINGFEQEKKVVVVAATNRKQDRDPALISRFDSMITFPLPDQQTRQEIAAQYAKPLTDTELSEFARATEGLSGRDMRDVCQQAERHWASKIIRGQAPKDEGSGGSLPPLQDYIDSARNRRRGLLDVEIQNRSMNPVAKKPQFDFV
ncbi:hypothetical protein RND71_034414 [Anisodus tanguticus]|uniref:AAA+ ATPase domain-containing protein n=1 Tax=Anisodus tanguticus TaxID=243964 RepID=A0AAE1RAJ1_9SOLA|nr:hypothetical protein RND71_034414 [Anisodus tanguticus]